MRIVLLVLGAFTLLTLPAGAAVQVLGQGHARACFEAARELRAAPGAIAECDAGLQEGLTRTERAYTHVNRGILHAVSGGLDLALADYAAAEALAPGLAEAKVNRGLIYLRRASVADALREIEAGLAAGCQEPAPCHYARAAAAEADGDLRGAYLALQAALAADPGHAPARSALANFRVERARGPLQP